MIEWQENISEVMFHEVEIGQSYRCFVNKKWVNPARNINLYEGIKKS
jgi:hypothetical protein